MLLWWRFICRPISADNDSYCSFRPKCPFHQSEEVFGILQSIAYIIKTDAMSYVAIYHADDMAPYTECPGCNLDSFLVQFCAHICKAVFRNKLAKLS